MTDRHGANPGMNRKKTGGITALLVTEKSNGNKNKMKGNRDIFHSEKSLK